MSDFPRRVREVLDYDPETGEFTWVKRRGGSAKPGIKAGSFRKADGYAHVFVFRKQWLAHRLAWTIEHGEIPPGMEVDHIDGDRKNNRISNLRLATSSQNKFNASLRKDNPSGVKGVGYDNDRRKWTGRVRFGERIARGRFHSKEEAEAFCKEAREKFHGEFANHGDLK